MARFGGKLPIGIACGYENSPFCPCLLPIVGYYTLIMASKKKERLPEAAERVKRTGHGMASATRGRARTFVNRKKKAAREACRGKQDE